MLMKDGWDLYKGKGKLARKHLFAGLPTVTSSSPANDTTDGSMSAPGDKGTTVGDEPSITCRASFASTRHMMPSQNTMVYY